MALARCGRQMAGDPVRDHRRGPSLLRRSMSDAVSVRNALMGPACYFSVNACELTCRDTATAFPLIRSEKCTCTTSWVMGSTSGSRGRRRPCCRRPPAQRRNELCLDRRVRRKSFEIPVRPGERSARTFERRHVAELAQRAEVIARRPALDDLAVLEAEDLDQIGRASCRERVTRTR